MALALGPNSVTVPAVSFNRSVKFQFSSGAVEFDDLTLNGVTSTCVGSVTPVSGCTDSTATNYDPLATVDDGSCTYPALYSQIDLPITWDDTTVDYTVIPFEGIHQP